jgi:F-type H+-transporting ATPase subunit delta
LNEAVASRYAEALVDVAMERREADRVKADLAAFADAFYSARDLRNVLETAAVEAEQKRKVIEALAARMEMTQAVRNFIMILVDHRRTDLLREIEQAFQSDLNARLGIAEARVTSARDLNDDEKRRLTAALERRTGKKIEARFHTDESLLGGAVVQVGSTVYDGSVREQLDRLRQQLEME